MPVRYWFPSDEEFALGAGSIIVEDADWWIGQYKAGVSVPIAASAATAASTAQAIQVYNWLQDDPLGALSFPYEDYNFNPLLSTSTLLYQNLPYAFDEAQPAPVPLNPEEEYWQNRVAPDPGLLRQPQQWTFDPQDPIGNLTATVDEYYWQNPTPPSYGPNYIEQPFLDPEELPAGSLTYSLDEYYREPLTPPVPGFLYQQLPYAFDDVVIVPQPAQTPQNYIGNPGAQNYKSQEIGELGEEF